MTWRTSLGERTLRGSEAGLIREGLAFVADMVTTWIGHDGDPPEVGIPLFDRLQPLMKLEALADVGWALLRETESCPKLTAVGEASVAAIYSGIMDSVVCEIDCQDDEETAEPFFWRDLVLAVVRENGEADDIPAADCRDVDEWVFLIDGLSNRILWDHDFNSEATFLDAAPEEAAKRRRTTGIDDDYFSAVPRDPPDSELPAIRARLRQLHEDGDSGF